MLVSCMAQSTITMGFCHLVRGGEMYPESYRPFQPFCGGQAFIVLQGACWSLYGIGLLLAGVCVYLSDRITVDGVMTSAGCILGVSQIILSVSLPHFEIAEQRVQEDEAESLTQRGSVWPKGTKRFTVTLSLISLLILAIADWVILERSDHLAYLGEVLGVDRLHLLPLQLCGLIALLFSVPLTIYLGYPNPNPNPNPNPTLFCSSNNLSRLYAFHLTLISNDLTLISNN